MSGRAGLALSVIASCGLLVAGCGGGGKKEEETSRVACKGPALTATPQLPADFPQRGELTWVKQQKAGPTVVLDGDWTSGLDEAYKELLDQVKGAGYKVLFTEQEERDAEISYSGSGRSGQIALRENCTEDETTRVHVTSRPA